MVLYNQTFRILIFLTNGFVQLDQMTLFRLVYMYSQYAKLADRNIPEPLQHAELNFYLV